MVQPTARPGFIGKRIHSSQRLSCKHCPLIANALMHLVNDGCFVAIYPILPWISVPLPAPYTRFLILDCLS